MAVLGRATLACGEQCRTEMDCAGGAPCVAGQCGAPPAGIVATPDAPANAVVTASPAVQPEATAATCSDGIDNDGDGYTDCSDQDCALFVFCARASAAGLPSSRDSDAGPAARTSSTRQLAPVLVLIGLGARAVDFYGGHASGHLAFGGGGHYFVAGGRVTGGMDFEGRVPSTYVATTGDIGYRFIGHRAHRVNGTALIALGYSHVTEREGSRTYLYHLPHARLSAGIVGGRGARFNFGLELSVPVGYGIHYNAVRSESSAADYSGLWYGVELSLLLSF